MYSWLLICYLYNSKCTVYISVVELHESECNVFQISSTVVSDLASGYMMQLELELQKQILYCDEE